MSKLGRFHRDETGAMVEKLALFSAALTLACVLGANLMSTMLQKGELPVIAFVQSDGRAQRVAASAPPAAAKPKSPSFRNVGVDMSSTGSIPAGTRASTAVSPCETGGK